MSDSAHQFRELDLVALVRPVPGVDLPIGQTGTVVFLHEQGHAAEVEFIISPRRSVVATVPADAMIRLHGLPSAIAG